MDSCPPKLPSIHRENGPANARIYATPAKVFAHALGDNILIRWTYTPSDEIENVLGWFVNRYRRQRGSWCLKGIVEIPFEQSFTRPNIFEAVAAAVKPDVLYAFTVQLMTRSGKADESKFSNAVITTPGLPDPWIPLYNDELYVVFLLSTKS